MGEKLGGLGLLDGSKFRSDLAKPPSADSVHVVLMQAWHADDRNLLQHCLYTQDDKVISKSIAQLNPSNVIELLHSLISIAEARGAILACVLPWLKCLLVQHASGIMSQEFSPHALNSLHQVIDEEVDEVQTVPVIYEDKDQESEDLVTDQDFEQQSDEEALDDGVSDIEGQTY